jgi:GDP/UDP-N,N'-diacetylbacillosamine 2-epimerase (hydrolysing)
VKILCVTGSRSDYDLLEPVLREIENHPAMELFLFASCAHLSHTHGDTISRIAGFKNILQRPSLLDWDTPAARLKSMSLEMISIAQDLENLQPDLVLILGDREDSIIAATAAVYSWIPVAHIFGGDSGYSTVDDSVRHAVSKLAHIHFTASSKSRDNLIAMGECATRVHFCGNPALDRIRSTPVWAKKRLAEYFGIDPNRNAVLVCQHPLGPGSKKAEFEMDLILDSITDIDAEILLNHPNSDPGSSGIIQAQAAAKGVRVLKNVEQEAWVNLLLHLDLMLGNSSMGILESAYLKIPAVNIGDRQRSREQAGNVSFVGFDKSAIRRSVIRGLRDLSYRTEVESMDCPFGAGDAAARIVSILETTDPKSLIPKKHLFSQEIVAYA